MPEGKKLEYRIWNLAFLVIAADQAAKYFFSSRIIKNYGLPFGIDLPRSIDAYLVASLLAIFIFCYQIYFRKPTAGFYLILGGAISNLADRVYFGYVRDFIHLPLTSLNLADIFIWSGIIILILRRDANLRMRSNDTNVN